MRVLEIGVAAGGEGAQQVQRRRRLAVGLELAARIGHARLGRELDAVDDVAAIGRQLDAADGLGRRRARLGELAGDAADLHHRRRAGEGQHHRHLQEQRGRNRGCCRRSARRSSRRSRRPAAGRPRPRRPWRARASACAPRLQKPAAESQRAAPRRPSVRPRPDRRAPAGWACLASSTVSNARSSPSPPSSTALAGLRGGCSSSESRAYTECFGDTPPTGPRRDLKWDRLVARSPQLRRASRMRKQRFGFILR